ncbi:hypothetical protein EV356DRAFT_510126 [Viridothelium virens]|uniref:Uncharacterized protein n=1 Tax=Viridothelium virens TaxID=1048519 RepID=A0A6A6GVP4_VIRVR|nr:hypothetical protein EV356DRAFT_510126 [Viridothelium virens]
MRLLEYTTNGKLEFRDEDVPGYAILSHTSAIDNEEEVRYQDAAACITKRMSRGRRSTNRTGYKKTRYI